MTIQQHRPPKCLCEQEVLIVLDTTSNRFKRADYINSYISGEAKVRISKKLLNVVIENYDNLNKLLNPRSYRSLWDYQLLEIKFCILRENFSIQDFIDELNKTWIIDHRGESYSLEDFYSDLPAVYQLGVVL